VAKPTLASSVTRPFDLTMAPPKLVGFPRHCALRKMLDGGGLRPEFAVA
jgi:hypothetical protein